MFGYDGNFPNYYWYSKVTLFTNSSVESCVQVREQFFSILESPIVTHIEEYLLTFHPSSFEPFWIYILFNIQWERPHGHEKIHGYILSAIGSNCTQLN